MAYGTMMSAGLTACVILWETIFFLPLESSRLQKDASNGSGRVVDDVTYNTFFVEMELTSSQANFSDDDLRSKWPSKELGVPAEPLFVHKVTVTAKMSLVLNMFFSKGLNDVRSTEYQSLSSDLTNQLNNLYINYSGVLRTYVLGFRPNNVIADIQVQGDFMDIVDLKNFTQNGSKYLQRRGLPADMAPKLNTTVKVTEKMSLVLNMSFSEGLNDVRSTEYQSLSGDLTHQLNNLPIKYSGVLRTSVLGFRPNIVIADFQVQGGFMDIVDLLNFTQNGLEYLQQRGLPVDMAQKLNTTVTGLAFIPADPSSAIAEGCRVKLDCVLPSNVQVGVTWTKNGETVQENGQEMHFSTMSGITSVKSTLVINEMRTIYEGNYTCQLKVGNVTHVAQAILENVVLRPYGVFMLANSTYQSCNDIAPSITCCLAKDVQNVSVTWYEGDTVVLAASSMATRCSVYKVPLNNCSSTKVNYTCEFSNPANKLKTNIEIDFRRGLPGLGECSRNGTWSATAEGNIERQNCPVGYDGFVKRPCGSGGQWGDEIYNCTSPVFKKLVEMSKVLLAYGDVQKKATAILSLLANATTMPPNGNFYNGDLHASATILETISKATTEYTSGTPANITGQNMDDFLTASSNILNITLKKPWDQIAKEGLSDSSSLLRSIERYATFFSTNSSIRKTNIVLKGNVLDINTHNPIPFTFENSSVLVSYQGINTADPVSINSIIFTSLSQILPMRIGYLCRVTTRTTSTA
ncbi:uncharacterized protein LOC144717877 [Lampetra planeri]